MAIDQEWEQAVSCQLTKEEKEQLQKLLRQVASSSIQTIRALEGEN